MDTLVLGIGNEILGDDGVGIQIAREVASVIKTPGVDVKETRAAGINLLEIIRGYRRLIIADAILTKATESGKIHRIGIDSLETTGQAFTPHGASLKTVLELGEILFPGQMPKQVVIFAVETGDIKSVTDEMTKSVAAAVPVVVNMILKELFAVTDSTPTGMA
jgi:hydrogenase maturation protease